MTSNRVRFPLKLKLLTVMLLLISLSLSVFVGIALKTFQEDKAAYIYETLLNKANSGEILLSQKLANSPLRLENNQVFAGEKEATPILKEAMPTDSTYQYKLIIPSGSELYAWHDGEVSKLSAEEQAFYAPMLEKSVMEAAKDLSQAGKTIITAYHYSPQMNYAFAVHLPKDEAFAVTRYLIQKSLFYGLFILGCALILSVLLARPLTANLETVQGLTQQIAQGNFHQRITLKSQDEVGALGESVNDMADKIVVYMEEMKEKARLENEVAVAQLVQNSFFPPEVIKDNSLEIRGQFEPATECGGDWWGVYEQDDWKVIFIADATGHGVPAALLTATMNCCKSSLSFILEAKPQLLSQPDEILRYMNQAVCGSGKQIQVTCFVATFNKKTLQLNFSNASHTPPLLYPGLKSELTKEDFQPLMGTNGPRLGQGLNSSYGSQSVTLKPHDIIILYTDGLTESSNTEGQRWGERRLIKALSVKGGGSTADVIQSVWQELKNFAPQKPEDDITLVALKVLA